jgi:hypothetical protein
MKIRYQYIVAFKLLGLQKPVDALEGYLLNMTSDISVRLTGNIDSLPSVVDEYYAIGGCILRWLFTKDEMSPEEYVRKQVNECRLKRGSDCAGSAFIIFQAMGNVECGDVELLDIAGYPVTHNDMRKDSIRALYEQYIRALITSFAIEFNSFKGVEKISDTVIFYAADDRLFFGYALKAYAPCVVTSPILKDRLSQVSQNTMIMLSDKSMGTVTRLLARSMVERDDRLLSFLSVWSAIEVFINKKFRFYETKIGDGHLLDKVLMYLYRPGASEIGALRYRFLVIAIFLDEPNYEEDCAVFSRVKKERDKLLHGEDVLLEGLLIEQSQILLSKYLKLHINVK